jgi:hypothetical protein
MRRVSLCRSQLHCAAPGWCGAARWPPQLLTLLPSCPRAHTPRICHGSSHARRASLSPRDSHSAGPHHPRRDSSNSTASRGQHSQQRTLSVHGTAPPHTPRARCSATCRGESGSSVGNGSRARCGSQVCCVAVGVRWCGSSSSHQHVALVCAVPPQQPPQPPHTHTNAAHRYALVQHLMRVGCMKKASALEKFEQLTGSSSGEPGVVCPARARTSAELDQRNEPAPLSSLSRSACTHTHTHTHTHTTHAQRTRSTTWWRSRTTTCGRSAWRFAA